MRTSRKRFPVLPVAILLCALALVAVNDTVLAQVSTTYLYNDIYTTFSAAPCVRLLNESGPIGCSARAASGILYPALTRADLTQFLGNGDLSSQYVVVMTLDMLSRDTIRSCSSSGKVAGIVVMPPDDGAAVVNGESPCPDCDDKHVTADWNPQGTGLFYDSFDLPIFAFANVSTDMASAMKQVQGALTTNRERSYAGSQVIAAELDAFMSGAHRASNCLRRGMCKPVGGQSVYAAYANEFTKPVVFLTATLDGKSLFHDLAPAATKSLTGTAALLTAAVALGQLNPNSFKRHLAFGLFTGEQWGHIGSRAFVRDLDRFQCQTPFTGPVPACPYYNASCALPCRQSTAFTAMTLDRVSHVLDANVVATGDLHVHIPVGSAGSQQLVDLMVGTNATGSVKINDRGLPPSPVLAFLERKPDVAVAAVSTLDKSWSNTIDTEIDNAAAVRDDAVLRNVCAAAQTIARTAWLVATEPANSTAGANPAVDAVNCTLARTLVQCLVEGTSCPLGITYRQKTLPTAYTGVASWGVGAGWAAQVAATVLANATAASNSTMATCTNNKQCTTASEACIGGRCIASWTNTHLGFPAGIDVDQTTGKFFVKDAKLPHWVESDWETTGFRMFVQSSTAVQVVELVVGIVVVAVVGAGAWVAQKKVKVE
ncbi:hypothetical protein GGF32_000074 [Allomyces javanicus]|nr:hypothetical protein GGF32_000074 [Allomyces javanicus]